MKIIPTEKTIECYSPFSEGEVFSEDKLNRIDKNYNKNQNLVMCYQDSFTSESIYTNDSSRKLFSYKEQTKFELCSFNVNINPLGIQVEDIDSRFLESEVVYKINKKHNRSLYRSEGRLHEKAEDLTFPQNRMQKYKLIDDYYQQTNKDIFDQIYRDMFNNNNLSNILGSPKKSNRKHERRSTIISNSESNSPHKSADKRKSIRYDYSPKKIRIDSHRSTTPEMISVKILERPAVKSFNTSAVNNYKAVSKNMMDKLSSYSTSITPTTKDLLKAEDLKTNKEKVFNENKKELVKFLEKNNQKAEVLCDKKLHYFYKSKRQLDEDKTFLNLYLGKLTPEEVILANKSYNLKQSFNEFNDSLNYVQSTSNFSQQGNNLNINKNNADKFRSQMSFKPGSSTFNNINVNNLDIIDEKIASMQSMSRSELNSSSEHFSTNNKQNTSNFGFNIKLKSAKADNFDTFRELPESYGSNIKSNQYSYNKPLNIKEKYSLNYNNILAKSNSNHNYFKPKINENPINQYSTKTLASLTYTRVKDNEENSISSCNPIPVKKVQLNQNQNLVLKRCGYQY